DGDLGRVKLDQTGALCRRSGDSQQPGHVLHPFSYKLGRTTLFPRNSVCRARQFTGFGPESSLNLSGKRILLIIGGGIAAYKSLELIRRLRERGASVRAILTQAGARFVTPLSVSSLTEDTVYQELFDLTAEAEMGHIALSRAADLVVVAPATADLMAKLAAGLAPDLASTTLLATDKPVLIAPAMNVRMWEHAATVANMALLASRGVHVVGPDEGPM